MSLPQYEVYAIRYATHERTRNDNFIFRDAHDGPMPIDFFVWVLRSPERTILVDTGFNEVAAKARQRVEDYLKKLQEPGFNDPGNFNTTWAELTRWMTARISGPPKARSVALSPG